VIEPLLDDMDRYLAAGNPFDLFDGFDRFTARRMRTAGLKRFRSPPTPFSTSATSCSRGLQHATRRCAPHWCALPRRLPLRKRQENIRATTT